MIKKTGELPKGKIDTRFVLPIIKTVKVGDEYFLKLESFVGYKIYNAKSKYFDIDEAKVLVKYLTGDKKGYVYNGKYIGKSCNGLIGKIEFADFEKYVTLKDFNGLYYIPSSYLDLYDYRYHKNFDEVAQILKDLPKEVTWQELSDIVSAHELKLADELQEARSKLVDKFAERDKLKNANDKIFE